VGPEIWVGVPPKRVAKKLKNMAPYRPALGPIPELTPKARASGKATMPAVIPPRASPLKLVKKFFKTIRLSNSLNNDLRCKQLKNRYFRGRMNGVCIMRIIKGL